MKFDMKDFIELDVKALFAINGGSDCGGRSNTSRSSSNHTGYPIQVASSDYLAGGCGRPAAVTSAGSCGSHTSRPGTCGIPDPIGNDDEKEKEEPIAVSGNCGSISPSGGDDISYLDEKPDDLNDSEENNPISHQTPSNPDGYHCDINSYNTAVDQGIQNPGDWDGNSLTVDQIYNENYSDKSSDSPVAGTRGYGFYDHEGDGTYDHMFYYDYSNGGAQVHVWNSDGKSPQVEEYMDFTKNLITHSVYVPLN